MSSSSKYTIIGVVGFVFLVAVSFGLALLADQFRDGTATDIWLVCASVLAGLMAFAYLVGAFMVSNEEEKAEKQRPIGQEEQA